MTEDTKQIWTRLSTPDHDEIVRALPDYDSNSARIEYLVSVACKTLGIPYEGMAEVPDAQIAEEYFAAAKENNGRAAMEKWVAILAAPPYCRGDLQVDALVQRAHRYRRRMRRLKALAQDAATESEDEARERQTLWNSEQH